MDITLGNISAIVLAIGALGAAAYGVVEAFGKAFAAAHWDVKNEETGRIAPRRQVRSLWMSFRGLPYVGFSAVQDFMEPLAPALKLAYGPEYQKIVLGQYRNGRGAGEAPSTVRQGVRMGITLLFSDDLSGVITKEWGLSEAGAADLADAISERNVALTKGSEPVSNARAEGLMAAFVTSLDARLDAAFSLAEERYQSAARSWAAVTSVLLVAGLNWVAISTQGKVQLPWEVALFIGVVAVPLAPVTKDLARALSEAVGAFRALRATR